MVGTTITGSVVTGVTLTSNSQNPVTVASGASVTVYGANASAIYGAYATPGTIVNNGLLAATAGYGVRLLDGGRVTNGSTSNTTALITGALYGIKTGARGPVTISNFGTITNTRTTTGMGIVALGGANVVNGSTGDTSAAITGYLSGVRIAGAGAAVSNFGTIAAASLSGSAVYLRTGGSVTNGGIASTSAVLSGGKYGVEVQHGAGTVTNFGVIRATGTRGRGVVLQAGGGVVNGSNANTTATIFASSRDGVYIGGTIGGSVANYGTIISVGPTNAASNGIAIRPGGTVTNGSATDTTATIMATQDGVYLQGLMPSAVVNFGTIQSRNANGLNLYVGGSVTNGSTADTTAAIMGLVGIYDGGPSTITNFASITGTGTAVVFGAGGSIINGATSDTMARITGGVGIAGGYGATTVTNFGTIAGTAGSALVLTSGGQVVNGGTANPGASIIATDTGIFGGSAPTALRNFGFVTGGAMGVAFKGGGSVVNGSTVNTRALISGGNTGVAIGGVQASLANFGTIAGVAGVGAFLTNGGAVVNGTTVDTTALITGANYGIRSGIRGSGTIVNFGTIANTSGTAGLGVALFGSGTVINGSTTSASAYISGLYEGVEIRGPSAVVSNFGKIIALSTLGVGTYLTAGGSVINGSTAAITASIASADIGVKISHLAGTVVNFGTIKGAGPYGRGIVLSASGSVVNGSLTDTTAYISGNARSAVYTGDAGPSYITNFGTIKGIGATNASSGVAMRGSGTVTNGAVTDTKATIFGSKHGVYIQGLGTAAIFNFGTISSSEKASVVAYLGGSVTNGGSGDISALITGPTGVYIGGPGLVANYGTITGIAGSAVSLRNGGAIVNGSVTDRTAMINTSGIIGSNAAVYAMMGLTSVTNFGTISSSTAAAIRFNADGVIVNGSSVDKNAKISGSTGAGIYLTGGTEAVTNFGTITGGNIGVAFTNGMLSATGTVFNAGTISNSLGTSGVAIRFGTGNNRLIAAPGAVFIGTVAGGGSTTLELAGGTTSGAISGLGTSFSNLGSVVVDAGSLWTLGKTNTVATMANNGTVFIAPAATLQISGSVDAASTGLFQLNAGSILEIAANTGGGDQIKFLGSGQVIVDRASGFGTMGIAIINVTNYLGPVIESFVAGDKIDLKDVAFSGTTLNYNAATGLLGVASSGVTKASLLFDKITVGPGSFHAANDGAGHTLITRG